MLTTAYFLVSGFRYFQKRDPVNSQRMMRFRVMAQFVTIIAFVGYMGYEKADWRVAPMYQERLKQADQEQQQQQQQNSK